eukprot:4140864-Amphidinium_carterae.3
MKSFRAPDHPLWGTCLTVSLVRGGYQKIYVRLSMDASHTNPINGCRALLTDSSLKYIPSVIIAHAQVQNQDGSVEITSATAVPEELLLELDWWIRTEWKVREARQMYEYLAEHTEAVTFMRASALVPTKKPEIINLRAAAQSVEENPNLLQGTKEKMPGLLLGHAIWNYVIREEAMNKFRLYYRHEHPIALFAARSDMECYYHPKNSSTSINFASKEYRVLFLRCKSLGRSRKGNWQWSPHDAKYSGDIDMKRFYFYWYGMVVIDKASSKLTSPAFLREAAESDRLVLDSTAPHPLGTLKNDFTRQRNQQDAEALTRETVKNIVARNAKRIKRNQQKMEKRAVQWMLRIGALKGHWELGRHKTTCRAMP